MEPEFCRCRIQMRAYTFYPGREEFVSVNSRFAEWVCVVPESGAFRYQVEAADGAEEAGQASLGDVVFAAPRGRFERHVVRAPLVYHVLQWSFLSEAGEVREDAWRAGKWPVRDTARLMSSLWVLRPLLGRSDGRSARRRENLLEDVLHLCWEGREQPQVLDALMQEAARLLRERAGEPLAMSEIARSVGLGPVQFTRRFRAAIGQNPIEFLTQARLELAQRLLIETPASLNEIAARCGWSSGAYLSSVFEKRLQTTPGRFRKSHRV